MNPFSNRHLYLLFNHPETVQVLTTFVNIIAHAQHVIPAQLKHHTHILSYVAWGCSKTHIIIVLWLLLSVCLEWLSHSIGDKSTWIRDRSHIIVGHLPMIGYCTSTISTLIDISCTAVRDLRCYMITNTVLHNTVTLGRNLGFLRESRGGRDRGRRREVAICWRSCVTTSTWMAIRGVTGIGCGVRMWGGCVWARVLRWGCWRFHLKLLEWRRVNWREERERGQKGGAYIKLL